MATAAKPAPTASGRSENRGAGEQHGSILSPSRSADNSNGVPKKRRGALSAAAELARLPIDKGASQATNDDLLEALIDRFVDRVVARLAQPAAEPREVLDTTQACEVLSISASSLWRLVREGLVRPRIIGASRRYLRSELLAFVAAAHAPAEARHG